MITLLLAGAIARTASLGGACNVEENRATRHDCVTHVRMTSESPYYEESFLLALNDPIEYFRYDSRVKDPRLETAWLTPYARAPVIGGLRDRFVNTDPFDSTLLFTVVAAGTGIRLHQWWGSASGDASLVYVKQRYTPNLIHSSAELDPEANRIYAYAQFGAMRTWRLLLTPLPSLTLGFAAEVLDLRHDGRYFRDREESAWLKWSFVDLDLLKIGFTWQWHDRTHGIRRDGDALHLRLVRTGLFVEI